MSRQCLFGDAVGIVLRDMFGETGDMAMHVRAAEILVGGDLAGRRLQQRRPGQEGLRASAHHHDHVGEAGHVGAARR